MPVSIVTIAILPHQARAENERPVSEEKRPAVSHAASELNVPYIFFEPERVTNDLNTRETALTKYNLKLDSSDYDYRQTTISKRNKRPRWAPTQAEAIVIGRPPRVSALPSTLEALVSPFKTYFEHEDRKIPFPGRELSGLGVEERAGIDATFGDIQVMRNSAKARVGLSGHPNTVVLLQFKQARTLHCQRSEWSLPSVMLVASSAKASSSRIF